MKNFRVICLALALLVLAFHIITLDFEDLRFRSNKSNYLGIVAMILVALSFLLGILKNVKKE
jgi:hypothetical protein